jgi:hypothetical protein
MKILILLILMVSCTPSSVKTKHILKMVSQDYSLDLETTSAQTILTSSLFKEAVPLSFSSSDAKILQAEINSKKGWTHSQLNSVKFDKIVLAPYYGLFSYYALQDLKRNNYDKYVPECPLNTKYLMILFHNQAQFPVFGCVF